MFQQDFPQVKQLLYHSTYVDDIVESTTNVEEAQKLARDTELVLKRGGFAIKGWLFNNPTEDTSQTKSKTRVLGVEWNPSTDIMSYNVPVTIPALMTRRKVLEQVMCIYDSMGILSPFMVNGKILLRKTWEMGLGWDDPLPEDLKKDWHMFLKDIHAHQSLEFDRCLTPSNAVGKPSLVLLSDASEKAYGYAAYTRWKLANGSYWCRLIMAKTRIAPMETLTIPRLELNAAVLSKRGRCSIEKEMLIDFDSVHHLIDSATVLCKINKLSTPFRLYEGVRIGEIQAATDGNLEDWKWIAGKENCADWITRGLTPEKINSSSEWWNGPKFLYQDTSF